MGTNFYSLNGIHIGKRSAAGRYCWDCRITLCKDGERGIHLNSDWYDACPKCGGKYVQSDSWENATGKELGFSKIKGKQTGVGTCCSFTWAIDPDKIKKWKGVRDEYGRKYTMEEFNEELDFCPVQYYHSIGKIFG